MPKLRPTKIDLWTQSTFPLSFIVLLGCMCLLALFGWLSQEVLDKEAFGFDTTILLWLHHHSNSTIDNLMLNITNLGNPEFVVVLVTISFSLLLSIGLSRLFLGVHYPTDIIAGYAVGLLWLITCVAILQHR
jgi:hypothetical protein